MAKNSQSTAVAKAASVEVSKVSEYGEDAGAGFENTTAEDITLPYVNLLQAMSPEVQESDKKIVGAKPGKMLNSVTGEIFDSVEFIPSYHTHLYVEWTPRKQGGGIVARHDLNSEIVTKAKAASERFGKYKTEAGNDLVETQYLYGVVVTADGREEPACVAFSSTKLKVFRNWWTRVNMFMVTTPSGAKTRPPVYAHRIRITSKSQTNKDGTFFNFVIQAAENDDIRASLLDPTDVRFQSAKSLRELVKSGLVKLDTAAESPDVEAASAF